MELLTFINIEQALPIVLEQQYWPSLVSFSILIVVMAIYTTMLMIKKIRSRESGWRKGT